MVSVGPDIETSTAIRDVNGVRERAVNWILLGGNRLVVSAGIVLAITLGVAVLVGLGLLAVGPSSAVATLFGSGITSGVVTLMTIALSINQLILSRVFGSPNKLGDRLEGTNELRQRVERFADQPSSPNDPAAFLSVIGTTIATRASRLQAVLEDAAWNAPDEVADSVSELRTYGENIDDHLEAERNIHNALSAVLGTGYAFNVAAIRQIRNKYAEELPRAALTELETLESLLESVAVTRQFFKTIALQEDLARLSRYVVYTGIFAFFTVVAVTLVYRTNSVTIPEAYLPAVVSVGIGVASTPLAVFSAFVLRSATIAHETLSVGPFVPPQER